MGKPRYDVVRDEIKRLDERQQPHNLGIMTGDISGVMIIDLDVNESGNGVEDFERLLDEHTPDGSGSLEFPTVLTPSGGQHLYFKVDDRLSHIKRQVNGLNKKGYKNIDILNNGTSVCVYPGSIYPGCGGKWESSDKKHKCGAEVDDDCLFRGKQYQWLVSPDDCPIPEIPEWLVELLLEVFPVKKKKTSVATSVATSVTTGKTDLYPLLDKLNSERWSDYESWKCLVYIIVNYVKKNTMKTLSIV
jgi:hypothetical protein